MYSMYLRLGLNVADSDVAVIRATRKRFRKEVRRAPLLRDSRHQTYRLMLTYHREARDLYRDVMRGDLSGE